MGCCSSSDAAGEKKPKTNKKNTKIVAVPDLIVNSSAEVTLERQVLKATYGPKDEEANTTTSPAIDVTDKLRALFSAGTKTIAAGTIESTLAVESEPFAGLDADNKVLSVFYISAKPDGEWEDFDNVKFNTSKTVLLATYGIDSPKDVTVQINEIIAKLKADGKDEVVGGIHTPLKEPLPMDPNQLKIWYA